MRTLHPIHFSPIELEEKWQKHVMTLLWIGAIVVGILSMVLLYGNYHGWFQSASDQSATLPPWPTSSGY